MKHAAEHIHFVEGQPVPTKVGGLREGCA